MAPSDTADEEGNEEIINAWNMIDTKPYDLEEGDAEKFHDLLASKLKESYQAAIGILYQVVLYPTLHSQA